MLADPAIKMGTDYMALARPHKGSHSNPEPSLATDYSPSVTRRIIVPARALSRFLFGKGGSLHRPARQMCIWTGLERKKDNPAQCSRTTKYSVFEDRLYLAEESMITVKRLSYAVCCAFLCIGLGVTIGQSQETASDYVAPSQAVLRARLHACRFNC
jgi:hypothetical protein